MKSSRTMLDTTQHTTSLPLLSLERILRSECLHVLSTLCSVVLTLPDSSSAFKHPSLMLHFRCLLGSLGHHFWSFGGPCWEPKSFNLGPWGALGTLEKPIPKNNSKLVGLTPIAWLHFGVILGSFFNDF